MLNLTLWVTTEFVGRTQSSTTKCDPNPIYDIYKFSHALRPVCWSNARDT